MQLQHLPVSSINNDIKYKGVPIWLFTDIPIADMNKVVSQLK